MTCTHHDGERCTLGLYGGHPSPGVCLICDSYDGPPRGAGDTVARITRALRLRECAGCGRRRRWLNERLPYVSDSD